MKKIIVLFCMVVGGFNAYAVEEDLFQFATRQGGLIDSDMKNMSDTERKQMIQDIRNVIPDEDVWEQFDKLTEDSQMVFLRSVLAEKTYESIKAAWMNDFMEESKKRNRKIRIPIDEDDNVFMMLDYPNMDMFLFDDNPNAQKHCEKVCYEITNWFEKTAGAYYPECEDKGEMCWNVTPIPDDYEEISLMEDNSRGEGNVLKTLVYAKDSLHDDKHVVYDVSFDSDGVVSLSTIDGEQSVISSYFLVIGYMESSFKQEREYWNRDLMDIKNGKMKDLLKNDGFIPKKWQRFMPAVRMKSVTYDYMGQLLKTKN